MGGALADGALRTGVLKSTQIVPFDHNETVAIKIKEMGLKKAVSVSDVVLKSDLIWLCVKAQKMQAVLDELKATVTLATFQKKCFVSIAAGLPIKRFETALGANVSVFRVMPNTPALLGAGMSGVTRGRFGSSQQEAWINDLLKSVGDVVTVPESRMDAVTAISGSGPAYVFYLAEALVEAAKSLGLGPDNARRLVHQTIYGAGTMLKHRLESADELRRQVTSPGGTTAAAIEVFDSRQLKKIVRVAVQKASARSKQLSKA